jgi:RNA polymerase sigma-70 factor (ECF subfamily)
LDGVTTTPGPSDVELVRRCARGDREALRLLHERHSESLLRFLERMLHDRARAEDVCQEAFLRIWRRAELFDPARGAFTAWLFRAAANLAFNRLALKSSSETELSSQLVLPAAVVESPAEGASDRERARLLHDALATLSARDRAILTLRHIEERPVAEIAAILDVPEGTVKSRCHYAMHRLRAALEPALGARPGDPGGAQVVGEEDSD